MTRLTTLLLATLLLACGVTARATTVCVSNAAALINAVNSFDGLAEGDDLTIKLVQGTYTVGAGFAGALHEAHDVGLQLLGGYAAGCASRTINPFNTVLDGLDQDNGPLSFFFHDDVNVLVEGITFTRFRASNNFFVHAILNFGLVTGTSDIAQFAVRRCRFIRNQGPNIVRMQGAEQFFVDNLVANNTLLGAGAAALEMVSVDESDTANVVTNNTIASNAGGDGVHFDSLGFASSRLSELADNIVYGNGDTDLVLGDFDSAQNPLLVGWNIYGDATGFALDNTNVSADPKFLGAGNYALMAGSPAINSGAPIQIYGFPSKDLQGGPRIVGSRVDRGAFESAFDDLTGFVVTTTADNGNNSAPTPNSLRAAIKAGNAAGGPFKISFAIAGGCPQILNIAGTMLDITGDVEIDGSTQAGWTGNTSYGAFDANLCLLVNGSGAATPWAFHVPASAANARLIVRGVMFAGFSDAALKIENGHDHRIFGNQFGAIPFTVPNHDAIRVTGAAGGAFIGGFDDTESVNLIAGSSNAGVFLDNPSGGSVLGNNVIGLQRDGAGNGGNGTGVYVFNSPNNMLLYNYIDFSDSFGVALVGAGSAGNKLQYNVIGETRNNSLAVNASAGVAIQFAARNNIVGATLGSDYGANTISSLTTPGVWVTSSGGAGNRVLANSFFNLSGVDVDLDAAGPSANQQSNPPSGPNGLQNYPVLATAARTGSPNPRDFVTGALLSLPNTAYRVEVYYYQNCPANGRGRAATYLGRGTVTTNAIGFASFSFDVPALSVLFPLGALSLTATDPAGNTSEIGNCVAEVSGTAPDAVFADGFE